MFSKSVTIESNMLDEVVTVTKITTTTTTYMVYIRHTWQGRNV